MKKLLSIVFALLLLFPSVATAEQEQPDAGIRISSEHDAGRQSDIAGLSAGSGENPSIAEVTASAHNDVVIVDKDPKTLISIWTPSDYSPKKKYDIFVFLQGSGENLNVTEVTDTVHYGVLISDIYESIDADFIVVGIQDGSNFQMISDRILYALSYVADHYSTYALSGRSKDLQLARDHIIVGGMSNGGKMATYFAIHYNAYVANAIIMSPTVAMNPLEGFHLKHLFVCIGTNDNVPCRPAARKSYAKLSPYAEHAYFSLYEGRHQWLYWNLQIALALNFVFDIEGSGETDGSGEIIDEPVEEYAEEQGPDDAQVHIVPFYACGQEGPLPALR